MQMYEKLFRVSPKESRRKENILPTCACIQIILTREKKDRFTKDKIKSKARDKFKGYNQFSNKVKI